MIVTDEYPCNLVLKKQLILEVCEPFMRTVPVKCRNHQFNVFKFGTFEYNDQEYLFGTEEAEYNSSFSDNTKKVLPVVFARREKNNFVLSPMGSFRQDELEMINESITYALESQQTLSHYLVARC